MLSSPLNCLGHTKYMAHSQASSMSLSSRISKMRFLSLTHSRMAALTPLLDEPSLEKKANTPSLNAEIFCISLPPPASLPVAWMKMKLTLGASPSPAASSKALRSSSGRTTSPSMHTTMASSCVSCVPPTRIFFSPRHDCCARKSVTFLCSSTLCVKNASRVLGSLGGRECFLANSVLAASILGLSTMSSPHATTKRAARVARRPEKAKRRKVSVRPARQARACVR